MQIGVSLIKQEEDDSVSPDDMANSGSTLFAKVFDLVYSIDRVNS